MRLPRRSDRRTARRTAVSLSVLGASLLAVSAPAQAHQAYDTETDVGAVHTRTTTAHRVSGDGEVPPTSIRITQANLKNGMTVPNFQADVGTVLAGAPDFVTYNEVPLRQDTVLAPPPGYAVWRTPGQYTGEAPVAWRTDRWTAVAEGTTMLSNKSGRLPGQKLDWGIRYANWVTVQDAFGHQVSVISAHLTPVTTITEGLQEKEIVRLGTLADTLGASGPVLVGGDLNMNYQTAEYFGPLLAQYNLVPSYDALGTRFPTGDHRGATIDYVMVHQDVTAPPLAFADHYPSELNSDHDAVTADLAFTSAPSLPPPYVLPRGDTANNPAGTPEEQQAALRVIVQAIDQVPAKGAIHITTKRISSPYVLKALDRALDRGVHVQAIFRARTLTPGMHHLLNVLGEKTWRKNFAMQCSHPCQKVARKIPLDPSQILISNVAGTPAVKISSDHALTIGSTHRLTSLRLIARQPAYDRAFRRFFRMAGHPL